MTVYVDVLVTLNIFVNYFLLLGTRRILKRRVKRRNLFFGAFVGGLYSLVIFAPEISDILTLLMNISAAAIIVTVTFTPRKIKEFLKCLGTFFLVNFLFAGLMLALWLFVKPDGMAFNNSVVYFDIDFKILVLSTVACYLLLTAISHFTKKSAPDNKIFNITLNNKGRSVMIKALLDTGNSITDSFTHKPVVIADRKTVRKLIDASLNDYFDGNAAFEYSKNSNVRVIPFNTIGADGVLRAVAIDSIMIHENNLTVNDILLAESKQDFVNADYSALLNNDIFNERGNTKNAALVKVISKKD